LTGTVSLTRDTTAYSTRQGPMVAVTWGRVRRELDHPGITVVDKTTGIILAEFLIDPTKVYQRKTSRPPTDNGGRP